MSRFILITSAMCLFGCVHVKKVSQPSIASQFTQPIFCSETNSDGTSLRISVDFKSADLKEWSIHKQFELPYIKRESNPPFLRISREILEWRNDRIVLAEIAPTEKEDLFVIYVTSFERSKHIKLTSSSYLLLHLCEEAEMAVGSDKELLYLKVKVELVGQPSPTSP